MLWVIMIAVAFWGLTRSTEYTADSIYEHIYRELPPHRTFMHTYVSSQTYKNERANERSAHITANHKVVQPDEVQIEDLDEVKARLPLHAYRTHSDPWNSNYETVDNFILAMYSKKKVTEMVHKSGLFFDRIIFARPDVIYLSSIAPVLSMAQVDNWVIPSFHLYSGFNDRFCITSYKNYMLYGNVFDMLLHYSRKRPLHSETFYADVAHTFKVRVTYAPSSFVFQRVRMNGTIDHRDLLLHELVNHITSDTSDTKNVELNNRIFRDLSVAEPFSTPLFGVGRVLFVRKPTRVVRRNVRIIDISTLLP
jgi:hypothetical protein